jgi:hypothetical protein
MSLVSVSVLSLPPKEKKRKYPHSLIKRRSLSSFMMRLLINATNAVNELKYMINRVLTNVDKLWIRYLNNRNFYLFFFEAVS